MALDLNDITKDYAKTMEYLAEVRDGSTGELGVGYWLSSVVSGRGGGDSASLRRAILPGVRGF